MNAESMLTRHDLEAIIVKRCFEDEAFRWEFTFDPGKVLTQFFNVPAASLPKIIVHQEWPGSWHIVLPVKPVNVGELSEQELEKVAGGVTPTVLLIPLIQSVSVAAAPASPMVPAVTKDVGGC
jgi:hypothetical protein